MKKLLMMLTLAGFMSAGLGLTNSFAQGDPNKSKNQNEQSDKGAMSKNNQKKDKKENEKSSYGSSEKKKNNESGSMKKDKAKEDKSY